MKEATQIVKFLFGTIAASIAISAAAVCLAQSGFRLSTSSPRALFDLVDQLDKRFGWLVTYEDAPVVAPQDLVDITSPNYHGPGRAYAFFSRPVTVQTGLPDPAVLAKQEAEDVVSVRTQERETMEAVLKEYQSSGNPGSFKMLQNGKYIHVFPDMSRDRNGIERPFEPMLSTEVTVPPGAYRLDQLLWLVCDQVAEKRGIRILRGEIPTGTFLAITVRAAAENEAAREVLVSAFENSKAVRAAHGAYDVRYFRWALLYDPDPDAEAYFMNVLWTAKDLPAPPGSTATRSTEAKQGSGSQWFHKTPGTPQN